MNNNRYWIWLSLALGYCNNKIKLLYEIYEDISDFYNGKEFEWILSGIFNSKEIGKLNSTSIETADKIINRCIEINQQIISIDNERFPERLRRISNPPAVLYVQGYFPRMDNLLSIAVVGTRKATEYGRKVAYSISYNLSKCKVTIVSGGALGIDSCAHTGALNANGITVSVLGCGINYPYLTKSEPMRKAITANGCLVSEYPPDTEALAYNFPARNRIISALSSGVLVVEAGKKSGSLITANLALEQNKDVFAVMGNITSIYSEGTNQLIKDGAVPVTSFKDILKFYNMYNDLEVYEDDEYDLPDGKVLKIPSKSTKVKEKTVKSGHRFDVELDEESYTIYHIIGNSPVHIDEIILKSQLPSYKIGSILTKLEVKNLIVSLPGKQYKLSDNKP
jgi:DNA processing protein